MKIITYEKNVYEKTINTIAEIATKVLKLPTEAYIELDFVSDEEIKEINNETRDVDKVTDVLSFPNLDGIFEKEIKIENYPFDIDPENNMLNMGSIIMCMDKLAEQAKTYKTGMQREFSYLLTHGVLHICGYDHMVESDKLTMRKKEEEILKLVK